MTEDEIIEICNYYYIQHYTINPDMSINAISNVQFEEQELSELPLNFNKVDDVFDCDRNQLTTLKGCPNYVGSNFWIRFNRLTTLEYSPRYVGGFFTCANNNITTLQHLPVNFYIGGHFVCENNRITDAKEFGKLLFGYIGNDIATGINSLDRFFNKNKNPPKKDLPKLLSELRKISI